MNTAALTVEGESEWLRLKGHVELSDHFALAFIFSAHPQVVELFRKRLSDIYRARVTGLQHFDLRSPSQLAEDVLPSLKHPSVHLQALAAPCWLDLSALSGTEWQEARLNFLARLNEQREPIRHAFPRPLILILPAYEREQIRALVPDLWAIRDFVIDTGNWLVAASQSVDMEPHDLNAPSLPTTPAPRTPYEEALVAEWERLRRSGRITQEVLRVALRVFDVIWKARRMDEAYALAQQTLDIARQICERVGETPESLRDLSVSLDNVGGIAEALGRFEEAGQAYEEGLKIAKHLEKFCSDLVEYRNLSPWFENQLREMKRDV